MVAVAASIVVEHCQPQERQNKLREEGAVVRGMYGEETWEWRGAHCCRELVTGSTIVVGMRSPK
jgi:hypothetical protein